MNNFMFVLFLVFTGTIQAQRKADPTPEEITKAKALKEKFEDDDVVLLSSKDVITFDFDKKNDKVTVLHNIEENLMNIADRSDIVKYYFYNGQTNISDFQIYYRTGKLASFVFKDEAYNSSGIFHNDSRVMYTNMDFPVKGYSYKVAIKEKLNDIKYFTQLFFPDEYPVLKKTIQIEVPNWLDLEIKEMNFEGYNIKKKSFSNKKKNGQVIEYTLENIPSRYKDKNAPGPTYVYPHILILAKSYTKNGTKKVLFQDTKDLYGWYKSLVSQLKNENIDLKEKVTELTANTKNDTEKIKNIYYWVQDNIRYIAFEDGIAGFKPDEANNVYTKRYGDCKGMANLTKQMLKEAGFDARLVWIGTKRIAYDYATPSLSVDNHMICALIKDKDTMFLDGTEKYNPLGEYAFRIQGKEALIENGDGFILKKVPELPAQANKESIHYDLKLEGENLIGKVSKIYNGESRASLIYVLNNLKKDKKDEALKHFLDRENRNLKVSEIQISDIKNRELPLKMDYNIAIKNAVSSFDGETYITLNLDNELSNFGFKKRKTDYLFRFKKDLESITELTIPKNYKVNFLPNNIAIKTYDFDLSVTYSVKENKIIYTKKFLIKKAKISTANFKKWNTFIKKLDNLYNEQLVLIKQ
ncbi:MAG TPA: hypothetical protein ENK67_08345 [Flavobacteriia bacterium]|nr:hypothetical protein [Flavobacteriia bacterium]